MDSLLLCEDQVYYHLKNLNVHKSIGLNKMCLRILRKMAGVTAKPLSMLLERSWQSGEVPSYWKRVNIVRIFKKGRKEDPEIYRPVSLTSVPWKVMEKILPEAMLRHMKDRAVI